MAPEVMVGASLPGGGTGSSPAPRVPGALRATVLGIASAAILAFRRFFVSPMAAAPQTGHTRRELG